MAEDEKFMMIYKRKNKQISPRVPNVDDQTPLPEENSEALLEKPTDNEDPVVRTYVSKSQNKPVGVVRCDNCGGDLHQTANSLQMEQDQWLFRNNGCVEEAENVNKQTAAENDTEVEGSHQASARFSSCMLENCITADEPDTRLYTDQNSNFQGTPGGLYDTDECFPDTMLEYVGEIMDNYLKLESKIPMYIQPSYLTTVQNDLISAEMRQDVVDWLIMVCAFMSFLWFMSMLRS